MISNEYDALIRALSEPESFNLVDLLRHSKRGGKGIMNPCTFAEYSITVDGVKEPAEKFLHNEEDMCSGQSLDYIFEVQFLGSKPISEVNIDKTIIEKFEV